MRNSPFITEGSKNLFARRILQFIRCCFGLFPSTHSIAQVRIPMKQFWYDNTTSLWFQTQKCVLKLLLYALHHPSRHVVKKKTGLSKLSEPWLAIHLSIAICKICIYIKKSIHQFLKTDRCCQLLKNLP